MPNVKKRGRKPKKKSKRDPFDLEDPDVYLIKAILGENSSKYQVDFEPNKRTGEVYKPEWLPKNQVNEAAVEEWEATKTQAQAPNPGTRDIDTPRKRKRTQKSLESESPAIKRRRQGPDSHRRIVDSSPIPSPKPVRTSKVGPIEIDDSAETKNSEHDIEETRPANAPEQLQAASNEPNDDRSEQQTLEIHVTPISTQQRQHYVARSSPTFDSSQLISGTAPQPVPEASQEQEPEDAAEPNRDLETLHTQADLVDAAAAPNLSQQHSQYSEEAEDPSTETIETTGSAVATVSSDANTYSVPVTQGGARIVPDSQSISQSASYKPSNQDTTSGEDSSRSQAQTVPESSAVQPGLGESGPEEEDNRILSGDTDSSEEEDLSVEDDQRDDSSLSESNSEDEQVLDDDLGTTESAVETQELPNHNAIDVEEDIPVFADPVSPASNPAADTATPERAISLSSASSPPPTEDPSESQRTPSNKTSSQSQSQSLDRVESEAPQPVPQPTTEGDNTHNNAISRSQGASDSRRPTLSEQSAQRLEDQTTTDSHVSSRFLTQIPLESLRREGPLRISSQPLVPAAPSQWPETFHSAPPRPETPSTFSMARIGSPGVGARTVERLSSLRERYSLGSRESSARLPSTKDPIARLASPTFSRSARSPSTVPAIEAVSMPTQEEDHTSERYQTLVPEAADDYAQHTTQAGQGDDLTEQTMTAQSQTHMGNDFHVVPICLTSQQRDHYKNAFVFEKRFIEDYLEHSWSPGTPMYEKACAFITRLHEILLHPDLLNEETFTQAQADNRDKARWDANISARFNFLRHLITALKHQDVHAVLYVATPRLRDILANFLDGHDVSYRVGDLELFGASQGGLNFTIKTKHGLEPVRDAQLHILFEDESGMGDSVFEGQTRRRAAATVAAKSTWIDLVVPNSIEHLKRCLQGTDMDAVDRMKSTMKTLFNYRGYAGRRAEGIPDNVAAVQTVVAFLMQREGQQTPPDWPIPPLKDMYIQAVEPTQAAQTQVHATVPDATGSAKRGVDNDQDETAREAKRLRTGAVKDATTSAQDMDVSHVSDSAGQPSQTVPYAQHLAELEAAKDEFRQQGLAMEEQIKSLQQRVQEHVDVLETVQTQFEEQRGELAKARGERDTALQGAKAAALRISTLMTRTEALQDERTELKARLLEAETAVIATAVPERAELELLRQAAEKSEAEKKRLEARLASQSQDLDYTRTLYQDVSSKATSLAEELSSLQLQTTSLEARASGETARVQQITKDNTASLLKTEIRKLNIMLKDREAQLKQKNEELTRLKERDRGRMGTRGSSQPRSPRLQSPLRLEPPRSSVGNRSRQASPVAGSAAGHLAKARAAGPSGLR